jgi:hypothetical protein
MMNERLKQRVVRKSTARNKTTTNDAKGGKSMKQTDEI